MFGEGVLSVLGFILKLQPIMKENVRVSGLALIAGSVIVMVTLILHGTERGLLDPAQLELVVRKMTIVHSLALVSLPLWFLGACGLSRRVAPNNGLGIAGLVVYGFALAGLMNAVVIDGLVTPGLARAIVSATSEQAMGWKIALNHNAFLDQAFMGVFLAASSVAIAVWSAAIVGSGSFARVLGIFGCSLGTGTLVAKFTGLLQRYPHLFFIVLIGQAIWLSVVGLQLYRSQPA